MDDIVYTVRKLLMVKPHYEVAKFNDGSEPEDVYDVIIDADKDGDAKYWCSCLGFRRQKYPKHLHKHVRLVEYHRDLGEPVGQQYKLLSDGTPQKYGDPIDMSHLTKALED